MQKLNKRHYWKRYGCQNVTLEAKRQTIQIRQSQGHILVTFTVSQTKAMIIICDTHQIGVSERGIRTTQFSEVALGLQQCNSKMEVLSFYQSFLFLCFVF